jgi:hypothetical protein
MTNRPALVALCLCALAAPAAAQSGRGKPKPTARSSEAVAARPAADRSTGLRADVEIRIIREYFAAQPEKPKSLPPGIARQLARGKPLPPGIAKKTMPPALVRQLPERDGMRWVLSGDVVLLVDVSDVIVDLVRVIL